MSASEARQIARAELLAQSARAGIQIEMPDRTFASLHSERHRDALLWNQKLCRTNALEFSRQRFFTQTFQHIEASARKFQPCQAELFFVAVERRQQRIA